MTRTIDYSDIKRALAHHVSGDEWIVEYAAVWDGQECVGAQIIRASDVISRQDIGVDGPLEPSSELYDRINHFDGDLIEDNAEWLQAEEDEGRLTYPIGAR